MAQNKKDFPMFFVVIKKKLYSYILLQSSHYRTALTTSTSRRITKRESTEHGKSSVLDLLDHKLQ